MKQHYRFVLYRNIIKRPKASVSGFLLLSYNELNVCMRINLIVYLFSFRNRDYAFTWPKCYVHHLDVKKSFGREHMVEKQDEQPCIDLKLICKHWAFTKKHCLCGHILERLMWIRTSFRVVCYSVVRYKKSAGDSGSTRPAFNMCAAVAEVKQGTGK